MNFQNKKTDSPHSHVVASAYLDMTKMLNNPKTCIDHMTGLYGFNDISNFQVTTIVENTARTKTLGLMVSFIIVREGRNDLERCEIWSSQDAFEENYHELGN